MVYCGLRIIHVRPCTMPRAKKAATLAQPLPKPTPAPSTGPQQQELQCKIHTNTHAVLLGLGALLIASFGMNLSALAANKKTEPTQEAMSGYIQSLTVKVDKLQRQLDAVSAQLLKACNDVSSSCLGDKNPALDQEDNATAENSKEDATKPAKNDGAQLQKEQTPQKK